jgi:hypothetical protein
MAILESREEEEPTLTKVITILLYLRDSSPFYIPYLENPISGSG